MILSDNAQLLEALQKLYAEQQKTNELLDRIYNATLRERKPRQPKGETPGSKVWEAYELAFQQKYNFSPPRNRDANTHCKRLAERLGVEDAVRVIRFYLQHADRFYIKNRHSLALAARDAEKLFTDMKSGAAITTTESEHVEAKGFYQNQLSRIEKGQL